MALADSVRDPAVGALTVALVRAGAWVSAGVSIKGVDASLPPPPQALNIKLEAQNVVVRMRFIYFTIV